MTPYRSTLCTNKLSRVHFRKSFRASETGPSKCILMSLSKLDHPNLLNLGPQAFDQLLEEYLNNFDFLWEKCACYNKLLNNTEYLSYNLHSAFNFSPPTLFLYLHNQIDLYILKTMKRKRWKNYHHQKKKKVVN